MFEKELHFNKMWKEFLGSLANILTCRERVYVRERKREIETDRVDTLDLISKQKSIK